MRALVATDLDRTLFPNGSAEYDGDLAMSAFGEALERHRHRLSFVTGRRLDEAMAGVEEYRAPRPNHIVSEVGTRIFHSRGDGFREDREYVEYASARVEGWNPARFQAALSEMPGLSLQEPKRQNPLKVSYYWDNKELTDEQTDNAIRYIECQVRAVAEKALLVVSHDPLKGVGLVDILAVDKVQGVEWLREKVLVLEQQAVVFCGDSGNDYDALVAGYCGVLVRNADEKLKRKVAECLCSRGEEAKLYVASGRDPEGGTHWRWNGNYVSGNIEGLVNFRLIDRRFGLDAVY